MDSEAFRKYGKKMVDFIADYWDSLRDDGKNSTVKRQPLPAVKPGYIWNVIPNEAPNEPEAWSTIFADLEDVVLSANTHWHHPHFYAYYPTACSYSALMGDMLSSAIASIGFTWNSSPAMTELEMAMTDWLARAIGLPELFLNSNESPGCGIIQSTASDATFVAVLSARARAVNRIKILTNCGEFELNENCSSAGWMQATLNKAVDRLNLKNVKNVVKNFTNKKTIYIESKNNLEDFQSESDEKAKIEISKQAVNGGVFPNHDARIFQNFVAYCSDQAHSSVEKDVMLAGVRLRKLRTTRRKDGNFGLSTDVLEAAIREDRQNGSTPFILVATVGTTNTCAVDDVAELGAICTREHIWLHVDAAYAGSFLLCEEFHYLSDGIEFVDSFNFNAHKAMMINFDCSPMWFKNATEAIEYFKVNPLYLRHQHQKQAFDYRHLQIALGRRFRALKIWFTLRAIGIPNIQAQLRKQVELATLFAKLITNNEKFELFVPEHLGLVCFRLKGDNALNERLNAAVNIDRRIHLVPASVHDVYFLRFALCSTLTTNAHVRTAFEIICQIADGL